MFKEITSKLDTTNVHIGMLNETLSEFDSNIQLVVEGLGRKIDQLMKAIQIIFHTTEIERAKQQISKISQRLEEDLSQDRVANILERLVEIVKANQAVDAGGGSP